MGTIAIAEAGLFMLTRFPQPGYTKTRLIPAIGAEGAAQLQRQMTEHLLGRFQSICRRRLLTLEVHFAGGTAAQMVDWLGHQVLVRPQGGGDLGQRLCHAFQQGFATGLRRILIVGSDCPGIGDQQINRSLRQLDTQDVVLGPAEDGGYYLIGLRSPQPQLFQGIHWGQSCVLQQTIEIARQCQLSYGLLSALPDIDRPEDLPHWDACRDDASSSPQVRL